MKEVKGTEWGREATRPPSPASVRRHVTLCAYLPSVLRICCLCLSLYPVTLCLLPLTLMHLMTHNLCRHPLNS